MTETLIAGILMTVECRYFLFFFFFKFLAIQTGKQSESIVMQDQGILIQKKDIGK